VPGWSSIRACWGSKKGWHGKGKDGDGSGMEGRRDIGWRKGEMRAECIDGRIQHEKRSKSANGDASLRQGALGSDARTPFTSGAAYTGQGDDGWLLEDGGEYSEARRAKAGTVGSSSRVLSTEASGTGEAEAERSSAHAALSSRRPEQVPGVPGAEHCDSWLIARLVVAEGG
jgi:hypothetical protein